MAESFFASYTGTTGADTYYALGLRFSVDVAGTVTHARWYNVATETGSHTIKLWEGATQLATFTHSTSGTAGWVEAAFSSPVSISAGTEYTIAVSTGSIVGSTYPYGNATNFHTAAMDNGGNINTPIGAGVYAENTTTTRPTTSYQNGTYFRDVVFEPGATPFPVVESITPTVFAADTTAHAVGMPATCNAGDLKLVLLATDGSATVTVPSGWTQLYTLNSTTAARGGAYARIHVAGDPSTVDFVTSAAERAGAQCYRISNWYGTLATGVAVGTALAATSSTPDPPACTPSWGSADHLWLAVGTDSGTSTLTSPPSGYTNTTSTGTSGTAYGQVHSARKTAAASSTENPGVFTHSAGGARILNTIAIRGAEGITTTLTPTTGGATAAGTTPIRASGKLPSSGTVTAAGATPALAPKKLPATGVASATGGTPEITLDNSGWLFPVGTGDHTGGGSGIDPAGDGTGAWYGNPDVRAADGLYAFLGPTNIASGVWTNWLRCAEFANSVPSGATITGIEVCVYIRQSAGAMTLEKVCLLDEGLWLVPSLKSPARALTNGWELLTYGGPTDTWGSTLTPAICSGTGFGVAFQARATAASSNVNVDYVQMRIHYSSASTLTLTPTAGVATAAGASPALTRGLLTQQGTATAVGASPAKQAGILPSRGTATAAGNTPALTLAVTSTLLPQRGLASASGNIPALTRNLYVTRGLVNATGNAPGVSLFTTTTLTPLAGMASATGLALPSLSTVRVALAGAVVASGNVPGQSLHLGPGVGSAAFLGTESKLSLAISPPEGIASTTGQASTLDSTFTALPGIALASGDAPDITVTSSAVITPQRGIASAIGRLPTLQHATWLSPQSGLASAQGRQPVRAITPNAGNASAQGAQPAIILQVAKIPVAGLAVAGGNIPVIARLLPVQAGAAFASGAAPTLSAAGLIQPQRGTATATGAQPALTLQTITTLTPLTGLVSATGTQPALTLQTANAPATGLVAASGNAPSLSGAIYLQPTRGIASAQGSQPVIARIPTAGLATAGGNIPVLTRGLLAQAGTATARGPTPARTLALRTATGTSTASGNIPAVALQSANSPIPGIASASGNIPSLQYTRIYAPTRGVASASGNAASLARQFSLTPGIALASGNVPFAYLQTGNSPLPGIASLTGNAPILTRGLAASRGTAAAVGNAPSRSTGRDLTAQRGTALAAGTAPTRHLAYGPAPAIAGATGNAPSLFQALLPERGIFLAGGAIPGIANALAPAPGTVNATGDTPDRSVTRFILPETGLAQSASSPVSLSLVLELLGTSAVRFAGREVEVLLVLPGNRREVVLSRFYARLQILAASGVLVLRNSTTPITIPPAGAIMMLDSGPDSTGRGLTVDYYEHRVWLELFVMRHNPLAKTIDILEDEVTDVLKGDRTLGGTVDQMFLIPVSTMAVSGEGAPVDVAALSFRLGYGEPHAL